MSKKKIRYKPKPHRQLSPARRAKMKELNKRFAAERQAEHRAFVRTGKYPWEDGRYPWD